MTIRNLDYIRQKDPRLYEALSDLLQQHSNLTEQVNGNASGQPLPPPSIDGVTVTGQNGHFHIQIQHRSDFYRGVQYYAEFADNAGFSNRHIIPMGDSREHTQFLGNGTYYWRAYAAYASSPPSAPAYHGGAGRPQPVSGGGSVGAPALLPSQGSGTGAAGEGLAGPGLVAFRSSTGVPPIRGKSSGHSGGGSGLGAPLIPSPATGLPAGMASLTPGGGGGGGAPIGVIQINDAATNSVTTLLTLIHRTSGTPAPGFGASIAYQLDSSTNVLRTAGLLDIDWSTATNGAESADFVVRLMNGGAAAAEAFRVTSAGNLKALGLGINTSPAFPLDILVVSSTPIRLTSSNQTAFRMDSTNSNAGTRNWALATNTNQFGDFSMIHSTALGGDPLAAGTAALSILNSGKVGLGNTNPAHTLDVTGDINSTAGFLANGTAGITGTLTTALLVGKTLTFTNGIITGFA